MPTVAENEPGMNLPWSNCTSRDVFPTPLSPTRIVCRKTHKIPQLNFLPLYIWSKYMVEAQSKLWWPLVIREQQEVAWLQSQLALKISLWLNACNHFIIFSCESTSVSWSTILFPSSTDIFFSKSLAVYHYYCMTHKPEEITFKTMESMKGSIHTSNLVTRTISQYFIFYCALISVTPGYPPPPHPQSVL